jgi:DNA-binding MarR family transcriptional regulator
MSDTDPADLAARFRQALMPLVRQLRTNVEEGMTPGQMSTLSTVARGGPITLGDLAAAENALEEKGLVERLPCPDDKRVVRVQLTTEGRQLLDRSARRRNTWLAQRFAALTDDERVALAEAVTVFERINREVGR